MPIKSIKLNFSIPQIDEINIFCIDLGVVLTIHVSHNHIPLHDLKHTVSRIRNLAFDLCL